MIVAALLAGACSGGGGEGRGDTLPPPPETTVTTAVDYAVPAVIDVAYVDKVMAALDHVYGDAIRTLAQERKITQDFLDRLAAIYTPKQFDLTQRLWVRDVAAGLEGLAATPGDPRTVVRHLLRVEPACVVLQVDRDFSRTHTTPESPTPQEYVALVPRPAGVGGSLNPTPWIMSFDGYVAEPAGAEPEKPCGE